MLDATIGSNENVSHNTDSIINYTLCFINSAQCGFSRARWDSFPINNGMQPLFGLTVPRREEPVFVLMVLAASTQLETGTLDYLNSYLTRIFMWLFTSNH